MPDHYDFTMPLAKKYSHSTYLSSSLDESERQVIVTLFSSSLFSSLSERKAFLQKAQHLKELQHPHILPLLDIGVEGEQPFVVRDYLSHGSLRSYLKELSSKRLELHDALNLVLQVGEALAYAHQQNIFHGNLKPENILFDTNGQALLTDFHLVSQKDAIIRDQASEEYAFCYMAPEQFEGSIDARSDQYALGCLAYELITERLPFTTQSLASMMGQPNYTLPAPLSEHVADLPSTLEAAILKTLAKDPNERFFNFSLFLDVIRSALSSQPVFPFLRSEIPHEQNATFSHTYPLKPHASSSSHPSCPKPKTSEVSGSSNAEDDLTEPTVASTESSVPRLSCANSLDELFTNLLPDSSLTHSPLEQKNIKSYTNRRDTVHEPKVEEIILPMLSPNRRDGSLKGRIQHQRRRRFWLISFGFLIMALVCVIWNNETAFLPVPVKKSISSVLVYQKPTQVSIQSLAAPTAEPDPSSTIKAKVPTPSTQPTTVSLSQTSTIDDSVMGTDLNQFNYVGKNWNHSGTQCPGPNCSTSSPSYDNTSSWDNEVNEYVALSFKGVQIKFYGVIDPLYGIGAVSVDGGAETNLDLYASAHGGDQLLWTSPMLPAGTHTFKLRFTGTHNPNAIPTYNYPIVIDRVDLLS
jgi:serine/threonine protein kinase